MSHQPERALTFLREDLERMSSKFEEMSYFKRQIQESFGVRSASCTQLVGPDPSLVIT